MKNKKQIEEKIKELQGEIEAIKNTKKGNDIFSCPAMDEIIEDNKKEIKELENDLINAKDAVLRKPEEVKK